MRFSRPSNQIKSAAYSRSTRGNLLSKDKNLLGNNNPNINDENDKYTKSSLCHLILKYICIIFIGIQILFELIIITNRSKNDKTIDLIHLQKEMDNFVEHKQIIRSINHNITCAVKKDGKCCRYAYIQLTDGSFDYLYGILAIHGALIRTKSRFEHHVMIMPSVPKKQINLFHTLGIGTYKINPSIIDPYLTECVNCWNVTFYKLFIFNMTEFDKILYLDSDVGIMSPEGIDELLLNYPTPAAVSDRANLIELNGGVLLVSPNTKLFNQLLKFLPRVRNSNTVDYFKIDPWNCEWREYVGDQGFINAFFNSNETDYGPFYPIHYRYGLLTSRFRNIWQKYYLEFRPNILKSVHFTVFKPWHKDGKNMYRRLTHTIRKTYPKSITFPDEHMARLFTRYWLDVKISLNKCNKKLNEYCKKHFTNPPFLLPDELNIYLKYRPEPFKKGERSIGYTVDYDTTKPRD